MSGPTEQVIERRADGTVRASGGMFHDEAVELAVAIRDASREGRSDVVEVRVRPLGTMAPTATPPGAELEGT